MGEQTTIYSRQAASQTHLAEHGSSPLQERGPIQAAVCRQAQLVQRQQHACMLHRLLRSREHVVQQALRQAGGAIRGSTSAGTAGSCPALQLQPHGCSQAAWRQVGRVLLQQARQQNVARGRRAAAAACSRCCCLLAGDAAAALGGRGGCRLLLRRLRQLGLQPHEGLHKRPPRCRLCGAKVQHQRQAVPQTAQRAGGVACLLLRV